MTPNLKVLVVEDEALLVMVMRKILGRLGADVVGHSTSGEGVEEMVAALCPDLVLFDIRLRDRMTGIDAARRVKERFPGTSFAFMTAYDMEEDRREALALGPLAYLIKPVTEPQLASVLERAPRRVG